MAVNTDKPIATCKKCGELHEKPLHAKCERLKNKEEKRDNSHEHSTKKTPRGKAAGENSQDKMLELVLQTMSGFTEKLSAMEERISGLTSGMNPAGNESYTGPLSDTTKNGNTTGKRQSRSREKNKRGELFATSEGETTLFTSPLPVNRTLENSTYAQTFPDTAVLVRQTPARAKKHKGDTDLGVTPLANITPTGGETPYAPKNILPKVTPNTASVSWPVNLDTHHGGLGEMGGKQVDQNFNMLTDQYGNPVEIQGLAPKVDTQQGEPLFTTDMQEPTSAQSLEFLRTNPYLQKLVENRVAVLEARMRNELQQGNLTTRKKSGRYNVSETTCAPTHLRWPNESCLTRATRKRTSYDDLTLGQFVVGFLKNAMDTTNPQLSRAMNWWKP